MSLIFALAVAAQLDNRVDAYLATVPLAETSAAAIEARCGTALDLAREARARLKARTGPASLKEDFAIYDTLSLILSDAGNDMGVIALSSPIKSVRDAAEACTPKLAGLVSEVSLSRPIFDRLSAIPVQGLNEKSAYTLKRVLLSYHLAGIDQNAATRARVQALNAQIADTGVKFDGLSRDARDDIPLAPEALTGLPQDYIDAHKPGPDGLVHLKTIYSDVIPVYRSAEKRDTRRTVMAAFGNRGWPQNGEVLNQLLRERYDLAVTLGYPDYATLITQDKMIASPARAAELIDKVNAIVTPRAERDFAEYTAFARTLDPSIDVPQSWDAGYLGYRLRKVKYDFDANEARRYFTLAKTQAGIFQLTHDLFGLDVRPWKTDVYASGVTAWEMWDGKHLLGRFYLDLSPRDGKYNGNAAQCSLRTGVKGRQLPVGVLLANIPASGPIYHSDVVTFLHEFGHLLHDMVSGHTQYSVQSIDHVQMDFIEAPSQMLEEWAWDYDTLKTFASDADGRPIPRDLVRRMNDAGRFGLASRWKEDVANSAISLDFYNRKPGFDTGALAYEDTARYDIYPAMAGLHTYASDTHLNGYSALVYTYLWSKVIAVDLKTRFTAEGMRNRATARAYLRTVLAPGASQDANALITGFLGRPVRFDAFEAMMAKP